MKRFLAVAAVALAAVAVYATVAPAGQQAVTPKQFAALSKKVTTLGKTVTKLKNELAGVETCALSGAVPIAQFGLPPSGPTEGYEYMNPDNKMVLETALDIADPATAQAFMLFTNKQCADLINGGKKNVAASLRAHAR